MALFDSYFHSESLRKKVSFQVIIPNDTQTYHKEGNPHYNRPMKALYLLHGYSDSSRDWLLHGDVQRLAFKYNLAVILPEGGNNFYLDQKGTGNAYETYVGVELPMYVQKTFGLAKAYDDNIIGGYSMGGYGAIHTGLNHINTFGSIIALSSALIIPELGEMGDNFNNDFADYDYYERVFGDLKLADRSHVNPQVLVQKILTNKLRKPSLYMACGTEDFLIDSNRNFYQFLENQAYPSCYVEAAGEHNWEFWNAYLEKGLDYLLKKD